MKKQKPDKLILIVARVAALIFCAAFQVSAASTLTLTVESKAGNKDSVVTVPIMVSDASTVAVAAFTINYNPTDLILQSVNSTFFDVFANQFADPRIAQPYTGETTAVVDGVIYDQPLVDGNVTSIGMPISASRVLPAGDNTNVTLFELDFVLNESAKTGVFPKTYDISVIPTTLNYTPAGYAETGETIDLIIGFESSTAYTSTTFPVLLDDTDYATKVTKGVLTFDEPPTDTDADGISDDWEMTHFGNLTTANATTDSDHDGYLDKDEFINSTDPKVKDLSGGSGYNYKSDFRVSNMDVDGNGAAESGTDGFLLLHRLLGFGGETMTGGGYYIGNECSRCDAAAIEAYIDDLNEQGELQIFDVDGNGAIESGTDGFLMLHRLLGFSGDVMTGGGYYIGNGAKMTDASIAAYIDLIFPK